MTPLLRTWFAKVWPQGQMRLRVVGEYAALKSSPHLLADIAARNFVFQPLPEDPHRMAICEGRRRAALEILELAKVDPRGLADVDFTISTGERNAA